VADPSTAAGHRHVDRFELERLELRRSVLLERLASAEELAAEREERIADLRLALVTIPRVRSGAEIMATENRPGEPGPSAPTTATRVPEKADRTDGPLANGATPFSRELARRGKPLENWYETFETFPRPRRRPGLRWPARRPPRD